MTEEEAISWATERRLLALLDTVVLLTEMAEEKGARAEQLEDTVRQLEGMYEDARARAKKLSRELDRTKDGHEALWNMLSAARTRAMEDEQRTKSERGHADTRMHLITEFEKYQNRKPEEE